MPFPDVERFVYGRNPLSEVICQIRFDSNLEIEKETPSEFQKLVREHFPKYVQRESAFISVGNAQPVHVSSPHPIRYHDFSSKEGFLTLTLCSDFMALSCSRYERWSQFKDSFKVGWEALNAVYFPSNFTRLGLRYRNLLGLDMLPGATSWGELLRPELWSAQSAFQGLTTVQNHLVRWQLQLNERDEAVLHFGTVLGDENTPNYGIDIDIYTTQEMSQNDVHPILTQFNRQVRRIFRWCISDELHNALQPMVQP